MDWTETVILRAEYVVMGLHLGFNHHDLDWGEVWISGPGWTWPGWRWDANIWLRWNLNGTQKGVTQEYWGLNSGDTGPGWWWDANLCTLMEVRWYTDRVYTSILGFRFLWERTWMEVRCTHLKPGWVWDYAWIGVKYILGGLGWRWFIIWKEVGGKYANLDWGETRHERRKTWILESKWSWDADHETWRGWDGPGFSWNAQLETWLGWHETKMGNSRGELDGGDARHGWWWHKILGTWIRVRQDLGGCALHNLRPRCVWDGSWMNLRLNFWDLNGSEKWIAWISDANICPFIDVEYNMDGEDTWIWESGLRSFPNL